MTTNPCSDNVGGSGGSGTGGSGTGTGSGSEGTAAGASTGVGAGVGVGGSGSGSAGVTSDDGGPGGHVTCSGNFIAMEPLPGGGTAEFTYYHHSKNLPDDRGTAVEEYFLEALPTKSFTMHIVQYLQSVDTLRINNSSIKRGSCKGRVSISILFVVVDWITKQLLLSVFLLCFVRTYHKNLVSSCKLSKFVPTTFASKSFISKIVQQTVSTSRTLSPSLPSDMMKICPTFCHTSS
jgi:hypothetical protein